MENRVDFIGEMLKEAEAQDEEAGGLKWTACRLTKF